MPTISGTVYNDTGTPVAGRAVRVYRRDTGALLGAVTSGDFDNVSLLLHMDGADGSTTFTDSSPRPKTVTRFGDAQISTAQSKFGGASAYFDGTGDYLSVPAGTDFAFGTGDFTIECWLRQDTVGSVNRDLLTWGPNWEIYTGASGDIFLWNGAANIVTSSTGVIVANTWHHIAVTRSGTSVRLFVDGTQRGSTATSSVNFTNAQLVYVNLYPPSTSRLAGYVDELRITKGVARYTVNFDVPDAPFQDDPGPGVYQVHTAYTGECNVVCLDDVAGTVYNDLILRTTPI